MKEIKNDREFEIMLKDSDKLLIVDFWASWCGPCKMYTPVFVEVSETVKNADFVKVNVEQCKQTAQKYGIQSIPATLIFNKGELRGGGMGNMSKDDLKKLIAESV